MEGEGWRVEGEKTRVLENRRNEKALWVRHGTQRAFLYAACILSRLTQTLNELSVFGCRQPFLEHGQYAGYISLPEPHRVEP